MRASIEIPYYFIYGEPPREVDPRFAHVEAVSDRSRIHGGAVRPHRHGQLHQLMLWTEGAGTYVLEDRSIPFRAPAFGLVPRGVVHGFDAPPPADAIVVSVSDDFLADVLRLAGPAAPDGLLQPMMLDLSPEEADGLGLRQLFEAIRQESIQRALGSVEAIAAYVALLLVTAARLRRLRAPSSPDATPQSRLAERFLALLEQRHAEAWPVSRYVRALGSTPYLLNAAVKASLDLTTAEAIAARRLTEAKRLLLYSNRTVSEIAYDLGYSSPAYFCRSFRKRTGRPPAAWRSDPAPSADG